MEITRTRVARYLKDDRRVSELREATLHFARAVMLHLSVLFRLFTLTRINRLRVTCEEVLEREFKFTLAHCGLSKFARLYIQYFRNCDSALRLIGEFLIATGQQNVHSMRRIVRANESLPRK